METFKLEKGLKPQRLGRGAAAMPDDFHKIKATMDVMEKEDSFLFPLNGYKATTIAGWIQKAEKDLSLTILDSTLRAKNKKVFARNVLKDTNKKETAIRIFRIQ